MSKTKAFIFDLDGVIVDSAKFHFAAWKDIASRIGYNFDEEKNEKLKGVSRVESLELILKWADVQLEQSEKTKLLKKKNELYLSHAGDLDHSDLLPGIGLLFQRLNKRGIKLAVGSASKNARYILDKLQISPVFDCIVDGTDVSKSKPDPEVFINAAKGCKVLNEECLVIEDSEAGLVAAQRASMKTIASGNAPELNIADYQLEDMTWLTEELLNKIIEE